MKNGNKVGVVILRRCKFYEVTKPQKINAFLRTYFYVFEDKGLIISF